jgi:hypothetical protein
MMNPEVRIELLQKLDRIQTAVIAAATQDHGDTECYPEVRRELLSDPLLGKLMPDFVRRFPDLTRFWPFIKNKFPSYAVRRQYIWDAFTSALEVVETYTTAAPQDAAIDELLRSFAEDHVHAVWQKSLERRTSDPEGAITAARTLLESVCKHILDGAGEPYEAGADLPKLYRSVAKVLKLAPEQHSEQVFRQILGGCQSVVEGLGAVRNRYSDAHGQGKRPVRPSARHAELAVNLAGAMATFLIATLRDQQPTAELGKSGESHSA